MFKSSRSVSALVAFALMVCLGVAGYASAADAAKKPVFMDGMSGKEVKFKYFIHGVMAKGTTIKSENGAAVVTIPALEKKTGYAIQLYFTVALQAGQKYKLTFSADSTKNGSFEVRYLYNNKPYTTFSKNQLVLKKGVNTYEVVIAPNDSKGKVEANSSIRLFLGNLSDTKVSFSNMKVEKL